MAGALLLAISIGALRAARSAADTTEALFSTDFYPRLGGRLGGVVAPLPFSVAEALVLIAALSLTVGMARGLWAVARGRSRLIPTLEQGGANALLALGVGYALFLALWGFNYARLPFAALAGLPVRPAPAGELAALASDLVAAANEAREGLAEDGRGGLQIEGGFDSVARRAGAGYAALRGRYAFVSASPARPKPVLLSPLLSRLGITGIYFPFTGEPNVNTTLPHAELPFSATHELAHQQGFAREDEANYVGYLACRLHPDADFRYSGLLAASSYTLAALHAVDPRAARAARARRSPAVLRDEAALRAWEDRYRGRATEVGHRVNEAYLRAQGQKEGLRSYGRMVDLLLAERRAAPAAPDPAPH